MLRISSGELQRKIGYVQDLALVEPVTITNNGRDRLVMMSAEEYRRLKRRDRQVMTLDDFTDEDIAALEKVRAPAEASAFNREVTE
jgi:PHD/YefM family antitoxin component YafN of YafNO toxin-antitoxin module